MRPLLQYLRSHAPVFARWGAVALGVFVVGNVAIFALYRQRTYPNAQVGGKALGSVSYQALPGHLASLGLLPKKVTLTYNAAPISLPTSDLGISLDQTTTAKKLATKHWLPVYNFFAPHRVGLAVHVQQPTLQQTLANLAAEHKKIPISAHLQRAKNSFELVKAVPGNQLDSKKAMPAVVSALAGGQHTVALPLQTIPPAVADAQLTPVLHSLQAQQNLSLAYTYQTKTTKPSAGDIAGWYVASGDVYVLADSQVQAWIAKIGADMGIRVKNSSEAVTATKAALQKLTPLSFGLVAAPRAQKTFSYCVAGRNVDASHLPGLKSKLQVVYGDARGWSLDGKVSFNEVSSGCNFTVWLASADQVPSFGSICDAVWSCTVSPNVIINFDRWQNASDAWNQSSGSLDDYRSMVINHETGHWLGFGHKFCGGAGQMAPVMQQQSIDLQGCKFNPWPLPSEQAQLSTTLGLQ